MKTEEEKVGLRTRKKAYFAGVGKVAGGTTRTGVHRGGDDRGADGDVAGHLGLEIHLRRVRRRIGRIGSEAGSSWEERRGDGGRVRAAGA